MRALLAAKVHINQFLCSSLLTCNHCPRTCCIQIANSLSESLHDFCSITSPGQLFSLFSGHIKHLDIVAKRLPTHTELCRNCCKFLGKHSNCRVAVRPYTAAMPMRFDRIMKTMCLQVFACISLTRILQALWVIYRISQVGPQMFVYISFDLLHLMLSSMIIKLYQKQFSKSRLTNRQILAQKIAFHTFGWECNSDQFYMKNLKPQAI